MEEEFAEPANVMATSEDTMGELVWYPLDYLMLDSQLCELVNNLTLLVPTRRESFDEQPILSRIKPSDNMNWNTLATHQEDSVPQEESSEENMDQDPQSPFPGPHCTHGGSLARSYHLRAQSIPVPCFVG